MTGAKIKIFSHTELRCSLMSHFLLKQCGYRCMQGTSSALSCIFNRFGFVFGICLSYKYVDRTYLTGTATPYLSTNWPKVVPFPLHKVMDKHLCLVFSSLFHRYGVHMSIQGAPLLVFFKIQVGSLLDSL
jgi:hypothetical protein